MADKTKTPGMSDHGSVHSSPSNNSGGGGAPLFSESPGSATKPLDSRAAAGGGLYGGSASTSGPGYPGYPMVPPPMLPPHMAMNRGMTANYPAPQVAYGSYMRPDRMLPSAPTDGSYAAAGGPYATAGGGGPYPAAGGGGSYPAAGGGGSYPAGSVPSHYPNPAHPFFYGQAYQAGYHQMPVIKPASAPAPYSSYTEAQAQQQHQQQPRPRTNSGTEEASLHPAHRDLRKLARTMQQLLYALSQATNREPGARALVDKIALDIRRMIETVIQMNVAGDLLGKELSHYKDEVDQLRSTLSAQNQALHSYKDASEKEKRELQNQARTFEEAQDVLSSMNETFIRQSENDRQLIQSLQDQVDGKRQMWLHMHPNAEDRNLALETLNRSVSGTSGGNARYTPQSTDASSSRPAGSTSGGVDPFVTYPQITARPFTAGVPVVAAAAAVPPPVAATSALIPFSNSHTSFVSTQSRSRAGAARFGDPKTVRTGSPEGRARTASGSSSGVTSGHHHHGHNHNHNHTGAANSKGHHNSTTVMINTPGGFTPEDPVLQQWEHWFKSLYTMLLGFGKSYFQRLPANNGDIARYLEAQQPQLWRYICHVLYPEAPANGAAHAAHLLNEQDSRAFLVLRLLVQDIINNVFCPEGWMGFERGLDKELRSIGEQLQMTQPHQHSLRQKLTNQLVGKLQSVVNSNRWAGFRSFKIQDHYQRMRKMVVPLIPTNNESEVLESAFQDLMSITETAWEMSYRLLTSGLVFQFVWSDTCGKFKNDLHISRNTALDPITLTVKQWRLKLVITPGITVLDNRNMSINVRSVMKSDVLVMV